MSTREEFYPYSGLVLLALIEIFRHFMSPFLAGSLATAGFLCIQFLFFSADAQRKWRRFVLELTGFSLLGGALAAGLQWLAARYPEYLR